MRLIIKPFSGYMHKLKEFISSNCDIAFELVHPAEHGILLKFVKLQITGNATSKLMTTWEQVKPRY